jgi:hypothetical protein
MCSTPLSAQLAWAVVPTAVMHGTADGPTGNHDGDGDDRETHDAPVPAPARPIKRHYLFNAAGGRRRSRPHTRDRRADGRATPPAAGVHARQANHPEHGAGSSNFSTLTFPDFVSLTGGPSYGGPHLSVTQSQSRLSQRIPFPRAHTWQRKKESIASRVSPLPSLHAPLPFLPPLFPSFSASGDLDDAPQQRTAGHIQ